MLRQLLRKMFLPQARTPWPNIIDLVLDESEDSDIIDLMEDSDDEALLDGPINCGPINKWVDDHNNEQLGLIVLEMPPPQEVMERLKDMLIREEDNQEANRAVDLLVRAGLSWCMKKTTVLLLMRMPHCMESRGTCKITSYFLFLKL